MDYSEPYLTLRPLGVSRDIKSYELPDDIWSEALNVRFKDGHTEKTKGNEQVFGTLATNTDPNWMIPVRYPTDYYWVYGDLDKIAVVASSTGTHSDITLAAGLTGTLDKNYSGGLINNLVVMHNGVDTPIWWDGNPANAMTALTAWPAGQTAAVIRPYKNYLVALNFTVGGNSYTSGVHWSDAAPAGSIPSSWDETDTTKDAGKNYLAGTPGAIIDGLTLGDTFVIYKRNSCYTMQFVGGQFIHKFRKVEGTVGVLTSDCAVEIGGKHLVLTPDDLVTHDASGAPPDSVLDKRMRTWLFKAIDNAYYERCFIAHHKAEREAWVCFPSVGAAQGLADTALIWNYGNDTLSVMDIPNARYITRGVVNPGDTGTWDADSGSWDDDDTKWDEGKYSETAETLLIGDPTNSQLLIADSTDQFDGVSMTSYVVRESIALLMDRRNLKLLKGLYPIMTSTGNPTVQFRIGTQLNATDSISWGPEQDFIIGTDDKIDILSKGRYISIKCSSTGDVNWQLHSFDLDIEKAERW